ncbi:MAG: divalent metal cation transporter, partial [Armatimonadetes bacterium]|nr:divalent metal cation transporter [Armatimonadota bacterium]
IPLSTAYAVCEAFGWEAGLDRTFKDAPMFLGLYTGMLITGALVVLIPRLPLIPVMLASQVLNGILLPVIMVFMLILSNDRQLMGEYTNNRGFNLIAGFTVGALVILTLLLVLLTLFPHLLAG